MCVLGRNTYTNTLLSDTQNNTKIQKNAKTQKYKTNKTTNIASAGRFTAYRTPPTHTHTHLYPPAATSLPKTRGLIYTESRTYLSIRDSTLAKSPLRENNSAQKCSHHPTKTSVPYFSCCFRRQMSALNTVFFADLHKKAGKEKYC